jgi:outer membrane lipoprotein-sorting protein
MLAMRAQQLPDGAALLKQSADALKNYNTYQYTDVATTTGAAAMEMTTVHQGTRSGKMRMEMRMEMKLGSMDGALIVSDGQYTWMYMAMLKRYMKVPAEPEALGGLTAVFGGQMMEVGEHVVTKVLRSETIDADGESHDCWVVESRVPDFALSVAGSEANVKSSVSTYWIDKVSLIAFKTMTSTNVQLPGAADPMETTMTSSRHSLKFNPPLDDSLFVFSPPPGATETEELFPGMKATLAKKENAPPAKTAVATAPKPIGPAPIVGEPQAYVPNLLPAEQPEAVYPDAARAAKVHGMVEALLIIDPAGSVVKIEPLAGPELLRPAAIEAVQQWKFRPVIRNGIGVYAYTDATVDFLDHGEPFDAGQMDISGQMAAGQRHAELAKMFPRSPQQVLADLEQDRGSGSGIDRSYALPDLAKAALKADALDKAAAYATEMLRSSSSDPNDGQAVHDGNMVLGMISLRQGDVMQAKHYLTEAGKTKGSPVLDSFGPNMLLAKGLIENGERDAVLEYFQACRAFWKLGTKQLDDWSAMVRGGGMPSFGASLVY